MADSQHSRAIRALQSLSELPLEERLQAIFESPDLLDYLPELIEQYAERDADQHRTMEKLVAERNEARRLKEQYEAQSRELEAHRTALGAKFADWRARVAAVSEENERLQEQLETAREERDLFYDRLQESREQLETLRQAIQAMPISWQRAIAREHHRLTSSGAALSGEGASPETRPAAPDVAQARPVYDENYKTVDWESNPARSRCTCTRDGEGWTEQRGCPEHDPASEPKENA